MLCTKVKTFLKLDKPAKRERCAELPGSDDDCNLDRSARGECQACRTCEENQYQAAPCTSEKDTECVGEQGYTQGVMQNTHCFHYAQDLMQAGPANVSFHACA